MKFHNIVISILIIGILTAGLMSYLNDLGTGYGSDVNLSVFDNTTNSVNKIQDESQEMKSEIDKMILDEGAGNLLIPYRLVKTAWKAGKIMFLSVGTVENVLEDSVDAAVESGIPIPEELLDSIIAIIIITLVAVVIYAFFRWRFTS